MSRLNVGLGAFIFLISVSSCAHSALRQQDRACFSSGCVNVEVVSKGEELIRGLQFRASLADNEGMLFVFPETSLHRFWMKDTLIPLDMIWFDDDKTVIFIQSHVPPCLKDPCLTYGPPKESRYVLEVNAGYAEVLGIENGSKARFEIRP